jgi:peptide/nickel transport system substrate-binding protein
MLAERVTAGELPPVEERLPLEPLVIPVVERIGDYGGTWRKGLVGGADDPLLIRAIGYDFLVSWNPEWTEVIPNVAKSFDVSDDATEFTFHLRPGHRWSDGHPFTAADIMFWYEDVLMNSEITPEVSSWLVAGGEPVVVEKLDDYTVVFRFAEPNGLFLQRMATPLAAAMVNRPRHWLEQFHADYNEDVHVLARQRGFANWVELFTFYADSHWAHRQRPTLNAWVIDSPYDGLTTRVTAERNPFYFKVDPAGNQLPYIDRVSLDIFEDREVLLLRALAGEIDYQGRHIAALANRAVLFDNKERGDFRFVDRIHSAMNSMILALNLSHDNPVKREIFNNRYFRIGLSHAINREELIDLVLVGQGEPWQAAPRPESKFFHEQLATQFLSYDVELANEHLDRAGYTERDGAGYRLGPDGNRITFVVEVVGVQQGRVDMLELIQGYFSEVGIDMQIRTMDRSLFFTRRTANLHDANVWGGDGGLEVMLDPRWYFPFNPDSHFGVAFAQWYNTRGRLGQEPTEAMKRQMELYDQLVSTGDAMRQAELMREILDIAAEEFYVIGIALPTPEFRVVRNNFRNVPEVAPAAWLFPDPGPYNPPQFFFEGGGN